MLSSKVSALAAYMMMSVKDVEVILAHTRGVIDAAKGFFELIICPLLAKSAKHRRSASCLRSLLAAGPLQLVSQYAGIETGRRLRNVAEFNAHLRASSPNSPN